MLTFIPVINNSLSTSQKVAHQVGAYPGFSTSMKNEEYFYSPLDGILVHRRVIPSIKFASIHRERHCESKASCPRSQHNVPGYETARSRVECTNHEAPLHLPLQWKGVYSVHLITGLRGNGILFPLKSGCFSCFHLGKHWNSRENTVVSG